MRTFFENFGKPTSYIMDELKEIDENGYIVEIGEEVSPSFKDLPKKDRREICKEMVKVCALQLSCASPISTPKKIH